jgi:hypothetical protein
MCYLDIDSNEKDFGREKLTNRKRYLIIVGIVAAVVLLAILFDSIVGNHPPTVTSLEAVPKKVIPSESCQIVCNATDIDRDELRYEWSASGGTISGEGPTVTWIAPGFQGAFDITVNVTDGLGGEVSSQVTITVSANRPPTINSLIADTDWTFPWGSLQVACDASDPNDDELNYEWSATGGNISGAGSEVIWTAPQKVGIYNITVVVTDAYGSSATRWVPVSVATGQPPSIEELRITKDRYGHCYLKPYYYQGYHEGYYVGQGEKYDIECVVLSDMSGGVSYEWSCTDGQISEISGSGSMITWIAPNVSGEVTVTVTVSDISGNMACKNLRLMVASCTGCTFPGCTG